MQLASSTASKLVWAAVVLGFCGVFIARPFYIGCALCIVLAIVSAILPAFHQQGARARWLSRAHENPIVLNAPFHGTWRVDSGGPDPKHNRHHLSSDQLFAYDFVPETVTAWDRPVLAPCAGLIAHVEDTSEDASASEPQHDRKRPLGNYIAIEFENAFVILAHLKHGSLLVRAGAVVQIGEEIARVGNSGTSTGAHLHVHAQDGAFSDPDVAVGLPIAFVSNGVQLLLEFGDRLTNEEENAEPAS